MRFSSKVIAGSLLGLLMASAGTVPGMAQANAPSAIDFGDDTSPWANDGECDDPRFEGSGVADEVIDAELFKDATDCKAAFDAGTATLKAETTTPSKPRPAPAAPTAAAPPARADIDFGDDSSEWANDGECDDPRFTGAGTAEELVDEDRLKDATDCQAAFEAGTVTFIGEADIDTGAHPMVRPEIDFGDDSSEWANDGECDDPRFTGAGTAEELVDADRMKDATDCRTAYEAGTVTLSEAADDIAVTPLAASDIDFGDDTSEWANDGECDDPRFVGTGVARETLAADIRRDASDCRAAVEAGTAEFEGEQAAMDFDFGSDFSRWANDGECDDLRFTGAGVDKKLLTEDLMGDASDCKALLEEGRISIRAVYSPEYAAGAPYKSSHIDFGDNSSSYADDGECDDPRFEGPGAATTLLESDRLADANDCKAAFRAGTIMLIEGES